MKNVIRYMPCCGAETLFQCRFIGGTELFDVQCSCGVSSYVSIALDKKGEVSKAHVQERDTISTDKLRKAERLESGPVQCGDDWPGIFVRGDDAARFSQSLHMFFQMLPEEFKGSIPAHQAMLVEKFLQKNMRSELKDDVQYVERRQAPEVKNKRELPPWWLEEYEREGQRSMEELVRDMQGVPPPPEPQKGHWLKQRELPAGHKVVSFAIDEANFLPIGGRGFTGKLGGRGNALLDAGTMVPEGHPTMRHVVGAPRLKCGEYASDTAKERCSLDKGHEPPCREG